ncbi:MAG: SagB/ThcOx family dehydrogenase [Nitrospirota bacterium]|jgi:SagB-type dehydrogenase family enzyme
MKLGVDEEERVALPQPRLAGTVSVEEALYRRRSVHAFAGGALALEEIAQLLWAAQGITDPLGLRTSPSGGALYPLEIYLAVGEVEGLGQGIYRYRPRHNELIQVMTDDRRRAIASAAMGQRWVQDNAAVLAIVAAYGRTTTKYGARGVRYVHLEAGHAAQNVYLQATAMGLGTVLVGAFEERQLAAFLGLPPHHEPIALMPVGRMATAESR